MNIEAKEQPKVMKGYDKPQPLFKLIPFSNGGAIGASFGCMKYTVFSKEKAQIRNYTDWAIFINLWSRSATLVLLRYSKEQ